MAIEVVGSDESKYQRATCSNCGSVLRYLRMDVKQYEKRDYSDDLDTYYFIDCPTCKKKVYVRG